MCVCGGGVNSTTDHKPKLAWIVAITGKSGRTRLYSKNLR